MQSLGLDLIASEHWVFVSDDNQYTLILETGLSLVVIMVILITLVGLVIFITLIKQEVDLDDIEVWCSGRNVSQIGRPRSATNIGKTIPFSESIVTYVCDIWRGVGDPLSLTDRASGKVSPAILVTALFSCLNQMLQYKLMAN